MNLMVLINSWLDINWQITMKYATVVKPKLFRQLNTPWFYHYRNSNPHLVFLTAHSYGWLVQRLTRSNQKGKRKRIEELLCFGLFRPKRPLPQSYPSTDTPAAPPDRDPPAVGRAAIPGPSLVLDWFALKLITLRIVITLTTNYSVKQSQFTKTTSKPRASDPEESNKVFDHAIRGRLL